MASIINASTSTGLVTTADTSGVLQLQTGGTTALAVSAAQVVTLTNPLPVASGGSGGTTSTGTGANVLGTTPSFTSTIGVGGATASASGAGITFPATQSASSDVNTLDDYEEGNWTPNQGGGLTVSGTFSSSGRFVKVGRIVYVEGILVGSTNISSATSGVLCSNLPFTSASGSNSGMGGLTNNSVNISNTSWVNPNSTSLYGVVATSATVALWFSATYQSAS